MNGAEQSRIEQNRTRFSRAEISFERYIQKASLESRDDDAGFLARKLFSGFTKGKE